MEKWSPQEKFKTRVKMWGSLARNDSFDLWISCEGSQNPRRRFDAAISTWPTESETKKWQLAPSKTVEFVSEAVEIVGQKPPMAKSMEVFLESQRIRRNGGSISIDAATNWRFDHFAKEIVETQKIKGKLRNLTIENTIAKHSSKNQRNQRISEGKAGTLFEWCSRISASDSETEKKAFVRATRRVSENWRWRRRILRHR